MALSAFDDKTAQPDEQALAQMLGRTSVLWNELKQTLQSRHGPLLEQWGFAGKAYGWSLALKEKKRALAYMTPCRAHFLVSFALGEKACRAAHESGLAPDVLALIDAAPRYAEGRGLRMPVRSRKDAREVEQIAAIKAAN